MISQLSLQKKESLSNSVSLQSDIAGYEFLIIEHQCFDAAIALHGGHLVHFQLKQQQPLIWVSKTALFNEQKAIRGGVPICWPWFGAADKSLGENLPSHGFVRTSKWSIKHIEELAKGLEIELSLKDTEETQKIWPYEFELVLKLTLTDTVKLELITKNTGTKSFSYSGALHTYFNISKPESCQVSGLNTHYTDSLNAGQPKTGATSVGISGPIDSIYQKAPAGIVLKDSGFSRQIEIISSGNDSEVLWTPWIKGAQAFADMPDDGYQTMLCIESTITREHGQAVAPNETHILSAIFK